MALFRHLTIAVIAAGAFGSQASRAQTTADQDLIGLWEARRSFTAPAGGTLVIDQRDGQWRASIGGQTVTPRVADDSIVVELPDGFGTYFGRFADRRTRIVGEWMQPAPFIAGRPFMTPVVLTPCAAGREGASASCFTGSVVPLADELALYLKVDRRVDGTLGAFLRNHERNLGRFVRVDRIARDGNALRWLDTAGGVVATGTMRDGVLSVYIPNRGGSYDFTRVKDGAYTNFYPRGYPTAAYTYAPPRDRNDGWRVGTLQDVGLDPGPIQEMMNSLVAAPPDSVGVPLIHGLLVARRGRLVLEEYFFGEHGDKPHDSRSASKPVVTVLTGAAMLQGARISPATRVYPAMRPGASTLDPRRQALTLEHLLTMRSGFDCDDNNAERPGNEDTIMGQGANPDYYSSILDLPMVREPGAQAVYCSINPHLAGGVLARIAGRGLPTLMRELVGEPMQMRDYHMAVTPLGDGYMGGGMRFRLRDFAKLGQLYLGGGVWNGRRIVSDEWVNQSTTGEYLWWPREYTHEGRLIRTYRADGNGGQYVVVVPELELVVASFAGNYNEAAAAHLLRTIIPRYILPAAR